MNDVKQTDSKDQIKKVLIDQYDIVGESLEKKTKKELWQMVQDLNRDDLDDLVETPEDVNDTVNDTVDDAEEKVGGEDETKQVAVPTITDYGWHDYVMGFFHKDELVDGNPTVDGMRRVCELLVGRICTIKSTVLQCPSPENERRATVQTYICLEERNGVFRDYDGSADAYGGNTDGVYSRYPVALAETRAEGRALKRALRLRKVISAEEVGSNKNEEMFTEEALQPINDTQKTFIGMLCNKDRLNLNVEKVVRHILPKIKNPAEIRYGEAKEVIMKLDELQRNPQDIPDELRGFDSSFNFS
jgi:hypothetical protein